MPRLVVNAQPAVREGPLPDVGSLPKVPPYLMLDAWRGLAALWVVMLHSCLPYILNGHTVLLQNPIYWVSIWGQLGVTVFFVISGYCITGALYNSIAAQKPLARFCAERFRRIFPPYLIALVVASALLVVIELLRRHRWPVEGHSAHDFLPTGAAFWMANATLTQVPAGHSSLLLVAWSLCFEVAFYGVMACLLQAGAWWWKHQPARRLALVTAGVGLLTCGSVAWLCASPATCPFPLQLWYQFGLGSLLFLWFAVSAPDQVTTLGTIRTGVCLTLALSLASVTLFAALRSGLPAGLSPVAGVPSSRVQAGATLIFCALLFVGHPHDAFLLRSKVAAVFARLGAISYSLYLVHLPLFPFVDAGLRKLGFIGAWYLVPYGAQIVVAVGAGWLFFVVVERRFISGRQVRRIVTE